MPKEKEEKEEKPEEPTKEIQLVTFEELLFQKMLVMESKLNELLEIAKEE